MFNFLPGIRFEALPDVAPATPDVPALPVEPAVPVAEPPALAAVPAPAEPVTAADLFGEPAPATQPEPAAGLMVPADEWRQMSGTVRSLADMIAEEQARGQQQQQPGTQPGVQPDPFANWDPFNPQAVVGSVGQQLFARLEAMLDQRLGGVEQVSNLFAEREATEIANQHFEQIEGHIGPFNRGMAMDFLGHALARGEDPSRALVTSAQRAQHFTREAMLQGAELYRSRLQSAAGAHSEPPAGAGGAAPVEETQATNGDSPYAAQGRASLARLRALPPAGA